VENKLPAHHILSRGIEENNNSLHPQTASFHEFAISNAFEWAQDRGSFAKPLEETSLFRKDDDNTLLAMLAERGFTSLTIADLGKLNPPDEFETELRIMAEVRGYFQVAYKVRIGFALTLYQTNNGANAHFLENH
jgi:hypothetical protein